MAAIEFPNLREDQKRIVRDSGLSNAIRSAHTIFQSAPAPLEFIPDDVQRRMPSGALAAGDEFEQQGKYVEVSLDQDQIKYGRQAILKARAEIETVLSSIEETINRPDRQKQLMFVLAVVLIVGAIAVILWGVVRGSHVALAGESGVVALLLSAGISWAGILTRKTWNLKTLTRRIRARLAVCSNRTDYKQAYECFNEALDSLDHGLATA